MRNGTTSRPGRSRHHRRRGLAAVEIAVVLPLMVTIALGCVDFGRFAYNYINVSNAARAAAAYEMMNPPGSYTSPAASWTTSIQNEATNEMFQKTYVNRPTGFTVTVATPTSNGDGTYRFSVTASYPFQTIVNWNFSMFGTTLGIPQNLTLAKTITMRFIRT